MTKKEFAKQISKTYDLTISEGKSVVNMCFNTLSTILLNGDEVKITGFGNFKPIINSSKRSYSINKGCFEERKPRNKVKFILSSIFEKELNGENNE